MIALDTAVRLKVLPALNFIEAALEIFAPSSKPKIKKLTLKTKTIRKFSKKIPILKAGNMSLGVNLLVYLTEIGAISGQPAEQG